ncbi:hypothetical protein DSO57_1029094 [Entomophthora muscae]|uniref:Uncharacterized protein n=2 Tax=Entomophthora muscae TaxID=34485 RepID=A0ACC2S3E6_9FUNG|nr:hypothetical protein DSO57_1035445 [Entomophthora muscae]KAJ9056816.1 hypothetical protein DSO57_1029094 [Entomophthora muscae]
MSGFNYSAAFEGLVGAAQENLGGVIGSKEMQNVGCSTRTKDGDAVATQVQSYADGMKVIVGSGLAFAGSALLESASGNDRKPRKP